MNKTIIFCTLLLLVFVACNKDNTTGNNDFQTTAYFISNQDTIRYSGPSKNTAVTYNATGSKSFAITLDIYFRGISDSLQPKLSVGQQIKLPYFAYYGSNGDHGTQLLSDDIAPGSGSTVTLTITRIGDRNFDASFSGKLWSPKDADTFFIKDGQLKQVKLPE